MNINYEIDKNISIADSPIKRGRPSKYVFEKMEIGDSVLVKGKTCSPTDCPGYNAVKAYSARAGKVFTGRAQGDGTVRIWRTA